MMDVLPPLCLSLLWTEALLTDTRYHWEDDEGVTGELEVDGPAPSRTEDLPSLQTAEDSLEEIQEEHDVHRRCDRPAVLRKRHMVDV